MFSLINSLTQAQQASTLGFSKLTTKSKYGINAEVNFSATGVNTTNSVRPNAFFGNEVTALGLIKGDVFEGPNDASGYSARIVQDDGHVSPVGVYEALRNSPWSSIDMLQNLQMSDYQYSNDNCVGLIYNLLRMYYITNNKDLTYKPDDMFYDNGHVSMYCSDAFGGNHNSKKITDIMFSPVTVSVTKPGSPTAFESAAVINYRQLGDKDSAILGAACGAWMSNVPFLISHALPQLVDSLVVTSRSPRSEAKLETLVGVKPSEILVVIDNLINQNNLHAQFDTAYAMLLQVLLMIKPRSIEAYTWVSDQPTMYVPLLRTKRGAIPAMLGVESYWPDPEELQTYNSWSAQKQCAYVHSVILQEAVMSSVFEVNNVVGLQTYVYNMTGVAFDNMGLMTDLSLVGHRYGKELNFSPLYAGGLDRFEFLLSINGPRKVKVKVKDDNAIYHYNLQVAKSDVEDIAEQVQELKYMLEDFDELGELDERQQKNRDEIARQIAELSDAWACELPNGVVTIDAFVPYVYPVLSIGVNVSGYYQNTNNGSATVKLNKSGTHYTAASSEAFVTFMKTLRMMGYDATGYSSDNSEKMINNWADNASGQFLYSALNIEDEHTYFRVRTDMTQRKACFIELPIIQDELTVNYTIRINNYVVFDQNNTRFAAKPMVKVFNNPGLIWNNPERAVTRTVQLRYQELSQAGFQVATLTQSAIVRPVIKSLFTPVEQRGMDVADAPDPTDPGQPEDLA